jgi:hypothetical protein
MDNAKDSKGKIMNDEIKKHEYTISSFIKYFDILRRIFLPIHRILNK